MASMQVCILWALILVGVMSMGSGGEEGRELAGGKRCANSCLANVMKLCDCKRSNGTVCENCCSAKRGCYLEKKGGDILCKGNYTGRPCPLYCISGLHSLCACKVHTNPQCVNCCTLTTGCSLYNQTTGAFICKGHGPCTNC